MRSLRWLACCGGALLLGPDVSMALSTSTMPKPSSRQWVSGQARARGPPLKFDESLRNYMKVMGQSSLLTVDEERMLAHDVQELMRWQDVNAKLSDELGREPTQTEWSEAVGYFSNGEETKEEEKEVEQVVPSSCFEGQLQLMESAKKRMIESNLRLVVSIAKQYVRGSNLALQDLIQEGTLGLIKATERYRADDPSQAKFATYASWWIRLAISRTAATGGRTIRLPARLPALIARAGRARDDFRLEHGREPRDDELAKVLGVSSDRLRLVIASSKSIVSLDATAAGPSAAVGESDSRSLLETLPDRDSEAPIRHLEEAMQRQALADTLKLFLNEEEHNVLCLAFGLDERSHTDPPVNARRTAEEVGALLGCSAEEAQRIETRAIRKLRGRRGLSDLLKARGLMDDRWL